MPESIGLGTLISAGTSILGGVMGSQKSGESSTSTSSAPWEAQQPYMTQGFEQAKTNLDERLANPLPTGPWVTPENQVQKDATAGIVDAGMAAPGNFGTWNGVGSTLAGGAPSYLNTAQDIASNGIGSTDKSATEMMRQYALTGSMPGASPGADPALRGATTSAATTGLGSVGQAQGVAQGVAERAADPNAGINAAVNGGTTFANSAGLNEQIDAASRDVMRNLNENEIRGIRQNANATGGANSSRAGAAEAIATRGAADRVGDIAAQMRGAAYSQGGSLGAGTFAAGLTAGNGAASNLNTNGAVGGNLATTVTGQQQQQGQFDTTSRLGAGSGATAQDLAVATSDAAARLGGNAQVGSGLTTGLNASTTALNGTLTGLGAAQGAGTFTQQQDQAQLTDKLNQWAAGDERKQKLLNDYWGIVGKPVGSSGTSQTDGTGGGVAGAIQGGLGGLALGTGLVRNNVFGTNPSTVPTNVPQVGGLY